MFNCASRIEKKIIVQQSVFNFFGENISMIWPEPSVAVAFVHLYFVFFLSVFVYLFVCMLSLAAKGLVIISFS